MEAELHLDLPIAVAAPLVVLCLALGAYMSAAETAITGASRPRMHRLAQQGNKRAAMVNGLLDRKDEAVSAVLLGTIDLHGHVYLDETATAEKAMLQSVLDLGDRTVGDVMTHRGSVVVI